ncbi:MAG: hypothetical protein KDE29_04355 [Anaerolineales bacterium]|nr:hypothetical protein [Anaerolineales bacterium]
MTNPAISAQGLRKEFGSKVAVADLTLQVQRGEVFGFLGPAKRPRLRCCWG